MMISSKRSTAVSEAPQTYRDAGVDIAAGEELVRRIKPLVKTTAVPGVLGNIGAFGGFFRPDWRSRKDPVLVSSVDGVGTKLKVALALGIHDTVGQDLVNHCVDDILACGAEPLFFLDYFATGKLAVDTAEAVIRGFVTACRENGCALLGGETAEMPGMYQGEDYDLAGTIVGWVEREKVIDGSLIRAGDRVVGLPSSGLHTNGYSLARKVLLGPGGPGLEGKLSDGRTVGEALLAVHRSYLKPVTAVMAEIRLHGISHITGGGIYGNTRRILPPGLELQLEPGSWPEPEIFGLIRRVGDIPGEEMLQAFNLGLGMLLVVAPGDLPRTREILTDQGQEHFLVGEIR